MISQNSIDAYNSIHASGVLAAAQWRTYDYLHKNPGKTRNEIDTALATAAIKNPNYSRRLVEMERMTILARGDSRKCSITGRMCDTWYTTNNMPVKVVEKKTWKQMFLEMTRVALDATDRLWEARHNNERSHLETNKNILIQRINSIRAER